MPTITGSSGNDVLNGTQADDIINAGDGNDTIVDRWGDDVIVDEAGSNTISGGDGNERITTSEIYAAAGRPEGAGSPAPLASGYPRPFPLIRKAALMTLDSGPLPCRSPQKSNEYSVDRKPSGR